MVSERCRGATNGEFCDGGVPAELELTKLGNKELNGTLHYDAREGLVSWAVSMTWPTSTYARFAAEFSHVSGAYREVLADFAHDGDVIVTVDGNGRWFFQSAHTGCTGDGALAPHGDGTVNVYDVELLIANCDAEFAHLNRSFGGVATRSTGGMDWGDWLVFWLSSPDAEPNPVALTMWGARL